MQTSSKKILIATGIFPPDIGGPASYVPKIAQELVRKSHTVTVLTYSDQLLEDSYAYPVVRVRRNKLKIIHYLKFFYFIFVLGRNAHVLYAQCPIASGLPVVIANFLLRKKAVIKVVGDAAWETSVNRGIVFDDVDVFVKKTYGLFVRFLKYIQCFSLKHFDEIIVPSFYLKNVVSTYLKDAALQKKISVIHNSFDSFRFQTIHRELEREKMGLKNKKVLLSVARLVRWKNIDILIKILPELDPWTVIFHVGDGPLEHDLKQLANLKNVSERISFLGKISKRELYVLYQIADAFILISEYEGQSHTLLEAMYMGLPVIVSSYGGNPETVSGYQNSILINNLNDRKQIVSAIQRSLAQEKDKNDYVIKNFSYDSMLSRTLRVLLEDK